MGGEQYTGIVKTIDNHNDMTDERALKKAERYESTLKLIIGAEVYRSDDKGNTGGR